MDGFCRLVANLASHLLEPDERDAVCGDLEEARATGARALREVLGLVARRQLLLWTDWGPWLALALLVVPLGTLLSAASGAWASTTAIYAWMYVDNWTWTYLQSAGSRAELERHVATFLFQCAALACGSWASGFAIALLSRRTTWITGALFCVVLFGAFPAAPRGDQHATVFALTFYRITLPILIRTLTMVFPAIWGMRTAAT